jgi:hypothetical protein
MSRAGGRPVARPNITLGKVSRLMNIPVADLMRMNLAEKQAVDQRLSMLIARERQRRAGVRQQAQRAHVGPGRGPTAPTPTTMNTIHNGTNMRSVNGKTDGSTGTKRKSPTPSLHPLVELCCSLRQKAAAGIVGSGTNAERKCD